jgi:hypothetical protein
MAKATQRPDRRLSSNLPTRNLAANVTNDASLVAFYKTNANWPQKLAYGNIMGLKGAHFK